MKDGAAKTLMITGAGRRFGKALAEHYLALGWRIIAHYNSSNELEAELGPVQRAQCLFVQADLSCENSVQGMIQQVKESGWSLDGIVHNASGFEPDQKNPSDWQRSQRMMAIHVLAPQAITMGLINHINASGCIISISDIYADMPNQRFAGYCASKAGLQNLSLSLAQRLAPKIRVNVIQPGPVKFLPEHDQSYRDKVLSQSLLKRELGYEPLIQACDYLLAADAVTGSVMRVDGGRFCANRYEQHFIE